MVRKPTYEIAGEIGRFDERDTVFAREALVEGSDEELDYHRRHPERAEVDRRLARFILNKLEGSGELDPVARALYESHFVPAAALALPDMVDGRPGGFSAGWSPRTAALKVKAFARLIGADEVRIGPLRREWVYTHKGSRPFFKESYVNPPFFEGIPDHYQGTLYGDAIELNHQTAISMGFMQEKDMVATGSSRAVDFECGRVYMQSVVSSVQLARFIRSLGYRARAHHLRNYLIMLVPVAVDSGMGELARAGYVVSRKMGANFRLSAVTTDMPLEYDEPVDIGIQDFCEKCKKCATNCPAGAITEGEKTVVRGINKWQINPEACLQYWGKTGYTCAVCQAVCPWTKPRNYFHRFVATLAVNAPPLRRALVLGDDLVYGARFRHRAVPDWLADE
ncbi:MAG: reductive dehalogenase [Candidatus Krumholzibacteriota bacterium]|nr:reductive dehalogenase [Candidatus Krumholzibacteriota bacterium]